MSNNEFEIAYSFKTFDGIISAGLITIEADSLDTARENAYDIVVNRLRDDEEDEDRAWCCNLENIRVSVTNKD